MHRTKTSLHTLRILHDQQNHPRGLLPKTTPAQDHHDNTGDDLLTDNIYRPTCPHCKTPALLQPLSVIFDKNGERYGFKWACPTCTWYDPDQFITKKQAEALKQRENPLLFNILQSQNVTKM